jgi:hypothetical protein
VREDHDAGLGQPLPELDGAALAREQAALLRVAPR